MYSAYRNLTSVGDIWNQEGGNNRRMEKIKYDNFHNLYSSSNNNRVIEFKRKRRATISTQGEDEKEIKKF
jgi:hypothetical protein